MASDLIRETRRAVLPVLKADAALTALVPSGSIYPATVPAQPTWPFIRLDGSFSTPLDMSCVRGAEVEFIAHAFAKARFSGAQMVETAEDHCARITSAAYNVLHRTRLAIEGGSIRLRVASTRIIQDGAEADAYHGILNVRARALV